MRRVLVLASLTCLALIVPRPGDGPSPSARGQAAPLTYALQDTWRPSAQPLLARPLGWPDGHRPGGMDSDPGSGRIFATDRSADSIRVYDATGSFEREIGAPAGSLPFRAPRDLALLPAPSDRLALSDTGNDRVLILTRAGDLIAAVDLPSPAGIAPALDYDPDGAAFYVVSTERHRIYGYDADGVEVRSIPLDGSVAPDGLAHPEVLAARAPGTDYRRFKVADPGAGQLRDLVFSAGGIRSDESRPLPGVRAVDAGLAALGGSLGLQTFAGAPGRGLIWLDAVDPSRATRPFAEVHDLELSAAGRLLALVEPEGLVDLGDLSELVTRLSWPDGRLTDPQRLAVGDRALISDASPYMQRLDAGGRPDGRTWSVSPLLPPVDVAAEGPRQYYLASSELVGGRSVKALDAQGRIVASWQSDLDDSHRIEAIAAAGGRVVVLDLLGQELRLLDADLTETARWSVSTGAFRGLLDVAMSPDRVFVANPQTGELEIWKLDGSWVGSVRVPTGPLRVAARDDGVAMVLTGADWIFAYDPDGMPLGAWPAGLPQERPIDLDLDAAGRLYVLDAGGELRVYVERPDVGGQLPPPSGPDRCAVLRDKGAAPREIVLGETVEVALVVEGSCPIEFKTADVVLAIDTSGSMRQENKMAAARNAAIAFLAQTDPLLTRVGLVSFAGEPTAVQALTEDRRRLITAVNGLQADGGTRLVPPLEASIDMVVGEGARPGANRVIVFMSDGKDTGGGSVHVPDPPGLTEAIQRARDAGIFIFTIGLGSDADERTLRRMAHDDDAYFFSPGTAELRGVYLQIARRIEAAELFERITVVDEVPDNMTFLPGSGRPTEPELSPDGRTLTWRLGRVFEPGFQLVYRLRPEEVGLWPTNRRAWADYVDGFGNSDRSVFPVPEVRVIAPTATPGPSPTPSPSATSAPPLRPAYLPLLLRERCSGHRLNIVLAIDTSSSMRAAFGPGQAAKIEAAREAARSFLERVDLTRDALSVIGFDETARIAASGQDRDALARGIAGLVTREGTRIDRALDLAGALLSGPDRLPGARAVVILLSDGAPTPGTEAAAMAAAAALGAQGVSLHTVAIGQDAARAFLADLAGAPDRTWYVADGAELARLYADLAAGLAPCRPSWTAPDPKPLRGPSPPLAPFASAP
ncbi:MAG: VWA domain-containing protein [Chloroflexi bacterium]|nr:VWA domain-containing protein [Chloroflexota bacterium]